LERVFFDYQPILESWSAKRDGRCTGVVRNGSAALAQVGAADRYAVIPAFTDWDPFTLSAARHVVAAKKPNLILSHGQRPARIFARVTPTSIPLAVCVHKPTFDIELVRTHYVCVSQHLAELALSRGVAATRVSPEARSFRMAIFTGRRA
jgi:hypothetical protein